MKVKVKKLSKEAVIPVYSSDNAAGLDLVATSKEYNDLGDLTYGTGLAIEIPEGYMGLLFPRSSISKTSLSLRNSVGVIDSDYRGEILLKFHNDAYDDSPVYQKGDKIAQLIIMPYPYITLVETDELTNTNRGTGGFGSTGR